MLSLKSCKCKYMNFYVLPYQQLIGLLDKPRRNWLIKLVSNAHGLAAFVLHIAGSPQEREGGGQVKLLLELSDKQQDLVLSVAMLLITAASRRCIIGCALALPMEQPFIDRVILIHGCGGVFLFGLVQRVQEDID